MNDLWLAASIPWADLSQRTHDLITLKYDFARDATLATTLSGALCGALGPFLLLKRLALLGDAAAHATLPGVCVAFLLVGSTAAVPQLLGALVATAIAAALISHLSHAPRMRPDAAISLVLSAAFGLGAVLLSYIEQRAATSYAGLGSILIGDPAGVSELQLCLLIATAAITAASLTIGWRHLAITTFDPSFAHASGVPTRAVHRALLVALSIAIVSSVQAVGALLVVAMLILPGSAALLLGKNLRACVLISASLGAICGALGSSISYLITGLPTGPAMVLLAAAAFALSALIGPRSPLRTTRGAP